MRNYIDASSVVGNPGLLDFYTPFLSTLHDKDSTAKLAIFAHSHIGHTPGVQNDNFSHSTLNHGLTTQVQSAIEAFDAIKTAFGAHTKVVIVGHSVGAWISLQVLESFINLHRNDCLLWFRCYKQGLRRFVRCFCYFQLYPRLPLHPTADDYP
jgi:hypothetical protein